MNEAVDAQAYWQWLMDMPEAQFAKLQLIHGEAARMRFPNKSVAEIVEHLMIIVESESLKLAPPTEIN